MKKEKLTFEEFKELPDYEVFGTGILPNSPDGIFMNRDAGELRWVAKKGGINDWAVYCHWSFYSIESVKNHGDKIQTPEYIKRCIDCDEEMMKHYRH